MSSKDTTTIVETIFEDFVAPFIIPVEPARGRIEKWGLNVPETQAKCIVMPHFRAKTAWGRIEKW